MRTTMDPKIRIEATSPAVVIFWLLVVMAIFAAGILVWPFLPAILWAAVFSILLNPAFQWLVGRGWNRTLASLTVTLVPTIVLIIPLAVMGSIAGVQVFSYVDQLLHSSPNGAEGALATLGAELDKVIQPILSQIGVQGVHLVDLIDKNKAEIGRQVAGPLANGLKSFVVTVVTLVISLLTMFFMIRDAHFMEKGIVEFIPLPEEVTKDILARMAATVRSVFNSIVVVSLIQGALAGLAYWVAGVPGVLVWTLVTTVMCMVPLIGAPGAYVPIALSLVIQGKVAQGVGVGLFGFLVISQIDNLLKPLFISTGAKLHPIPVFFSLLGGVLVLGPVGLMAGPMLLTFLMAVFEVLSVRRQLVSEASQ